jgi:hypothetical protein
VVDQLAKEHEEGVHRRVRVLEALKRRHRLFPTALQGLDNKNNSNGSNRIVLIHNV